ncbi:MAG: hypothetical protein ABII94_03095, partial [Patescibacteria group bacterium]
ITGGWKELIMEETKIENSIFSAFPSAFPGDYDYCILSHCIYWQQWGCSRRGTGCYVDERERVKVK